MANKGKKINRQSFEQRFEMTSRIKECINVIDKENRIVDYKEGHSDASIAKEYKHFGVNGHTISFYRRETFGNFPARISTSMIGKQPLVDDRFDHLLSQIMQLQARVDSLENQKSPITETQAETPEPVINPPIARRANGRARIAA